MLIVNATASSVTARRRVVIQKALGADHDLEVAETHRRGHAARLARAAALDGTEVVVVLAGDGTLNEAADGLAGSTTALAALPGGSTNVYARTIGVEPDPIDATSQLLAALDRKSTRRIGVGSADSRRFLFHLGIGFDAEVIQWVERRPTLKRWAAHPLFIAAACDTWLRHYDRHRIIRFADQQGEIGRGPFAIISKTTPYTFLGSRPLVVSPAATLDSPLALAMFRTIALPTLLPLAASALTTGRMAQRHPRLIQRHPVFELEISDDTPFPWQVDGDYLGETDRLSVRYEPDALTLVVP
jgi:diacylglycerol kinase family enzyme